MSMSLTEAEGLLGDAADRVRALAAPSTRMVAELGQVAKIVAAVRTGGHNPPRMGSTMIFAAEILKIQQQQQARLASLLAALEEMSGR